MIVVKSQVANPENEQAVADFLRQICGMIFPNDPTNFANCDTMIAEYTDDIIELLINEILDPLTVNKINYLLNAFTHCLCNKSRG